MNVKLLYWWDVLRDKLWFIPSVFCLISVAVAILTLNLDAEFEIGTKTSFPAIQTTGSSGRVVLGALIGALVTVVGLAFSVTMLSVAQTSSQYGPRLIRSLFDSNVTQYMLGMLLATIVYCMVILRSIRDIDESGSLFTPSLSILVAELAGAACMLGLLRFTNHMTNCMRAETLIMSIYRDLLGAASKIFPEFQLDNADGSSELTGEEAWKDLESSLAVESCNSGYLQAIDLPAMIRIAEKGRHRILLEKRPGEFVYEGETLARIECEADSEDQRKSIASQYRGSLLMGSLRTPRQDIEAGVLELVEAGVRALSPGVNDPMTAINVIDYLSSFLRRIVQRDMQRSVILDSESEPRIRVKTVTFPSVLNAGFDQLRQYAADSVAVHCRLLEGLTAIARVARRDTDRDAIRRQAKMIVRKAEQTIAEEADIDDIQARGKLVEEALGARKVNTPK